MKILPPDIGERINQSIQTKGNNADPQMEVFVVRAKSSVQDASYFIVEDIRNKAGLTDISVATRRMRPFGPPDGIFVINIDGGIAKVLQREYPDVLHKEWQDVFVVGPAKSVAITFDGQWDRFRKIWQLVTVEHPDIFWVQPNGTLLTRHWEDTSSQETLATGVSKVKAIRGWRNTAVRVKDTGVIAAYIKTDGKVYYRNYCEQAAGPRIWEGEVAVTEFTGVAVNLNLFLTNDYRTAIAIEDNVGKIHWIITGRNWAGMAIAPEKFSVTVQSTVKLLPVAYTKSLTANTFTVSTDARVKHLYANVFNMFNTVVNIDNAGDFGNTITFTTKHRMLNLNPLDFVMTDTRGIIFNCISITETDTTPYDWEYTAQFTNFNNAWGIMTLFYKSLYTKNEAGYLFAEFSEIVELEGLIPEDIPAPLILSITNINDTGVLIEFDSPIVYGMPESLSAFTVTGHYWKDINKTVVMTEGHIIASVEALDDTHALLVMKYPTHRIRRAHSMDIVYNAIDGFITGQTYPLESFEKSFVPSIIPEPVLDPIIHENFKMKATIGIDLTKVAYSSFYVPETDKFAVSASGSITLTKIGEVNP